MMSDVVCKQFYRNQGRFAGPLVDYTELQRGMLSYSSSYYNDYDRMSIDVIYYTEYNNKVTFTFNVIDYYNHQNTMISDNMVDQFTDAFFV